MAPKRKDRKQAEEKPATGAQAQETPDLEAAPKTPDSVKDVKQEPPGTPKTAKRSKAAKSGGSGAPGKDGSGSGSGAGKRVKDRKDAKTEQQPAKIRRGSGSSVSGSAGGKSDVGGAPGKDGSSVKGDESTDPELKVR